MTIKNKTVIGLLALLCVVTVGGEAKVIATQSTSTTLSPYQLIDPGIQANVQNYCWYDDERLVFLLGQYSRSSGGMFQSGGLYYLDIRKPTEHHRIDLSPLSESEQKTLNNVYCKDKTILFSLGSSSLAHPDRRRAYSLKLSERPELIAEMRGLANPLQSVHLKAKYVLGNSRRIVQEGPLKGAFEGHDDCSVAYVKPGFKVLCWDTWLKAHWPLSKFVIAEYRWEDRIKVKGEDGKKKYVPNPEQPRLSKDGKIIYGQFELRNFNNELISPITFYDVKKRHTYAISAIPLVMQISFDEEFLYLPCNRVGDHDIKFTVYEYICRIGLSANQGLEEVFSIHSAEDRGALITELSLSQNGDVYFKLNNERKFSAIWKYSAQTKKVEQVTQPPLHHYESSPQASPDGKKVAFKRPNQGYLKVFIVKTDSANGGERK